MHDMQALTPHSLPNNGLKSRLGLTITLVYGKTFLKEELETKSHSVQAEQHITATHGRLRINLLDYRYTPVIKRQLKKRNTMQNVR